MRAADGKLAIALALIVVSSVRGHGQVVTPPASASTVMVTLPPPALVLGTFEDDYKSRYVVTPQEWQHGSRATYHVTEWHPAERYAIAQNDEANPGEKGRWSRIDWMSLEGMAPFTWAYCLTVYDSPTPEAARAAPAARRDAQRPVATTSRSPGCDG